MKKKNMFSTTMAAVAAVVMIYTVTGCGTKNVQTAAGDASSASAKETQAAEKIKATQTPTVSLEATSNEKTDQKTDSFLLYAISKDGVNIRQEPSVSSDSIGMGGYGDSFTCSGSVMGADGSSWYRISYQGKTGYISTAYASKSAPSGSSSDKEAAESDSSSDSGNTSASTSGSDSGSASASTSDPGNASGNSLVNDSEGDGEASLNLKTVYLVADDGTTVVIKEQTNGNYAYRDDNGVGYIDEGDGVWIDQYDNIYKEQ